MRTLGPRLLGCSCVCAFCTFVRSFVRVSNFIEFEISRIESNDVIVLRIYRVQIVSFYYKFIFWFRFLFSFFFFFSFVCFILCDL